MKAAGITTVLANGCSCTRGEELARPEATAWPSLLADQLNLKLINVAADGSSNRRIVRSTVGALPTLKEETGLDPSQVLVIIAWSQLARHEYLRPYRRLQSRSAAQTPGEPIWNRIGPWLLEAGDPASAAYFEHMWSDRGALTNFFLDWLMIDGLLRMWGCHVRYVFSFPLPEQLVDPARHFAVQLNPARVMGGIPHARGAALLEMPPQYPRGDGGHPLEEGHRWFASRIGEWLETDSDLPLLGDRV